MDQVKQIGQILLAQRFWIICGIITFLPLGGWYSTTAAMRKTTAERKTQIDGKFKQATEVANRTDPPNETVHQEMDKLIAQLKQQVADSWQLQWEQQTNLLVWPKELGEDFERAVRPLNPFEKVKFPTPPTDEIGVSLRERYRDYIKRELPKLAQIIDAKWMVQEDAPSAGDGAGGAMMAQSMAGMNIPGSNNPLQSDTSKVLWSQSDQAALAAKYNWHLPKTIDVLYAQEDLWLMTAILQIIAETNEGATGRYNAVVKEIKYISLGRAGSGSVGTVTRIGAGAAGGGMGVGMGMDGGLGMGMSMGSPEGGMGVPSSDPTGAPGLGGMSLGVGIGVGMGGGTGALSPDPAEYRYVDGNYQPIPAATVRGAIESDAQNLEEAYLLVAKRIPVRMGLTIDQRKLNKFIAACGNSKLMVEVRQVRFNRQSGPGASGSGGGMGNLAGMAGMANLAGMMEGGMLSQMTGGGGFGGGFGGMAAGSSGEDFGSGGGGGPVGIGGGGPQDLSGNDKPVEIFGVVYIYNPVDQSRLKLEEAAAQAAEQAATGQADPNAAAAPQPAPQVNPVQPDPAAQPNVAPENPAAPNAPVGDPGAANGAANPAVPNANPAAPANGAPDNGAVPDPAANGAAADAAAAPPGPP